MTSLMPSSLATTPPPSNSNTNANTNTTDNEENVSSQTQTQSTSPRKGKGKGTSALQQALNEGRDDVQTGATAARNATSTIPKTMPNRTMKAVQWNGTKSVVVNAEHAVPAVTDEKDVVIRVTSAAVCGSDLHLYLGAMAGMERGDVLGHETMGIVVDVGPQVKHLNKGDRVVVAFDIACGECFYCQDGVFSSCDFTNPSEAQEKLYGHRTCGAFGYSHLTGGYWGGQAEYLRVPYGDVNCLRIPGPVSASSPSNSATTPNPDGSATTTKNEEHEYLPDDKVLFLSDILPTAWWANECGQVGKGDVVAVMGAGPVGVLACQAAFARGAKRVLVVDTVQWRLDFAQSAVPGVEPVLESESRTGTTFQAEKRIAELCRSEPAGAPDVVLECVGMHYATTLVHKAEMALSLETDSPEALNTAIRAVRKGGRIGVVGVYAGLANHFNLGALMEKGLTMRLGQTSVQKYWKDLLGRVRRGELDPSVVVTHRVPLEEAPAAYSQFNSKEAGVLKVVFRVADADVAVNEAVSHSEAAPSAGTVASVASSSSSSSSS